MEGSEGGGISTLLEEGGVVGGAGNNGFGSYQGRGGGLVSCSVQVKFWWFYFLGSWKIDDYGWCDAGK